ncbi:MAG: G5 domain-containing protein [Clostridia bacterium]|nr:G5 domain-containing protein [Clostridia bacterium]
MAKQVKISNSTLLIICSIFIIGITALFLRKIFFLEAQPTYASTESYEIVTNKNPINIENILKENTCSKIEEEMILEEIDLEYITEYRNNDALPTGTIQVVQEGRDGRQNAIIIKKYENGELISEELVAENLIKAAVNKIVEVGTGAGVNNYIARVGDTVYVTSNLLAVRLEPNSDSEKLATLKKGTEVKIQKIDGDWLYISSKEQNGYVASNCITNINPNNPIISDNQETQNNINGLDFNMNLNIPSGFTIEQFKKVLCGQPQDTNGVFATNAEYFYYAEKQYNINGIFLASVAIHESGFGTSKISLDKKNLFGYGAVDSNPYGGAYSFNTYAEGIDLLARVFKKYYLNPEGTVIYDGNVANGKFYNGNTLSSVNIKYASDKNWANSVYKWMEHLYNSL